ncbi:peroxisome biogenesis protein 1 isoform X2 [Asparagus officinalis]|uniref:peroxisome biogenesis protein 1 isoform X2 n=1 Tax=Asparagus officinalis TaxID=4686 RepID=UPI00098E443D|nr:peroxisome biogenesis protein 1 isoform X2 [Asparagus officinalis]
MELEVRVVGGIESCFVSVSLQTLASTVGGPLPPVLALDLRSPAACWHVSWAGSASGSSSIEIAQKFAECISLPDGSKVKVKAAGSVPKAAFVTVEPSTEDDWEILELNSELAEEAILKQVGIVNEGMRFPLWLHGHTIVEFLVVSTSPKKSVVQLVPGTEVAVAPKVRKQKLEASQDVCKQSLLEEQLRTRALLRVQELDKGPVHRFQFKGVELGVALTTVAFIHPDTAQRFSFDNLQLVTIQPRLAPYGKLRNGKDVNRIRGNTIPGKGETNEVSTNSKEMVRYTVVRILFSNLVAKGHVMLPQSLRRFIGAGVHSWVYVKKFSNHPKRAVSLMTLSPCQFKLLEKNRGSNTNGIDNLESQSSLIRKSSAPHATLFPSTSVKDWWQLEQFLTNISTEISEVGGKSGNTPEKRFLIQSWFIGQLKAIASYTGQVEVTSVVLTSETLFHFEVIEHKSGDHITEPLSCGGTLEKGSASREPAAEFLYLLKATFDEPSHDDLQNTFQLVLSAKSKKGSDHYNFELPLGNVELGEPVTLEFVAESCFNKNFSLTLSSLSWMEKATSDVISRLFVLLSSSSGKLLNTYDLPHPGHVLIYGPSGSGKSTLSMVVARHFEEHPEILAHIVFISCSKLSLEKSQTIRQAVTSYISEALVHSPSIVIFDDLDNIVSVSSDSDGPQPSGSSSIVKFFSDILDEYWEKCHSSCGYGPIAFVASAQSLGNLPQSLSSSGRFDFHIELPAPAVSERGAILKHEIQKRVLHCSEDILSDIASKCDGYDAYDLEILVDRAVHAAVSRFLSSHGAFEEQEVPALVKEDFSQAMHDFVPVAMRGLTKAASDGGRSGWEDVGGLVDIRNAIQEMIELPSKFPSVFASSPLRLRSNVLLYGPPGCGKTHVVGAAAAACSLRFISIKGPELLNKYIGASEQAVRDLFSKAASAAPCLLFFDEFDSIAPKRGHDNTGVTDRVVNQFLTELDGVEALTGVFVFAATRSA